MHGHYRSGFSLQGPSTLLRQRSTWSAVRESFQILTHMPDSRSAPRWDFLSPGPSSTKKPRVLTPTLPIAYVDGNRQSGYIAQGNSAKLSHESEKLVAIAGLAR